MRANFVRCLEPLARRRARTSAIATHDEHLIAQALRLVGEHGLGADEYEFQMLLGVRADRADELVAAGTACGSTSRTGRQWYEYSVRRLQENPQIAGYVAADTLGRSCRFPRSDGARSRRRR